MPTPPITPLPDQNARTAPARRPLVLLLALALLLGLLLGTTAPRRAVAAPTVSLGGFETGTEPWSVELEGGATATLGRTTDSPGAGTHSGRLTADLSQGIAQVGRGVEGIDATRLSLMVRSEQITRLGVRLVDGTGQIHQQYLALTPGTGWQQLQVDDFAGAETAVHWGGADDGVWHQPLQRILLLVEAGQTTDPQAVLDIDQVTVDTVPADLAIAPVVLGNVFTAGDAVAIGFETSTEQLEWVVRDAAGAVVAEDSAATSALAGRIDLGELPVGWYRADLTAVRADGSVVTGGTDLAVLPDEDVRDRRLGVSTHYGGNWNTDSLPLVAAAGYGFARDESYWAGQETVAGRYDWTPKLLDYRARLRAADVDWMHIWSYGNPLHHEGEAPATEAGRQAFAAYAKASVDQFGTEHTVHEVWNEWNWRDRQGPAGATAENYVALLAATRAAVHAAHPDAVLAGPALAPVDDWQGWVDDFIAAGGLDLIDAFSTHPYNFTDEPEAFESHLDWLRDRFAAAGHPDLPIWITEKGWHTSTSAVGVSEAAQARDLVRSQLVALADGVESYTTYDLMDDGLDPAEPEHRFGVIRNPGDARGAMVPKPAYVAQAVLARAIVGRTVTARPELADGGHSVAWSNRSGESDDTRLLSLWATTGRTWQVAATGPVTVTDMYGTRTELVPDSAGKVHLGVGPEPIQVLGPVGALTPSSPYDLTDASAITGRPGTAQVSGPAGASADAGAGSATTAPGGAALTLPATSVAGPRHWTATVTVQGRRIGLLSARAEVRDALALTGSHALSATGESILRLRVHNRDTAPATVDGVGWQLAGREGNGLQNRTIPAGGTVVLDVPAAEGGTWSATIAGSRLRTSGVLTVAEPTAVPWGRVTVDGTLDPAITAGTPVLLGADQQVVTGWRGEEDLSGRLWWSHDGDSLYLSAEIRDDAHSQPARGGDTWQGDNLQLGITDGWPGETHRQVDELGVALTDAGPVDLHRSLPSGGSAEGLRGAVTRDEQAKVTRYEFAVPFDQLGVAAADGVLSATVAVNENDGAGRRGWSTWGRGVAESKDPELFQPLRLLPKPAGTEVALKVSVRSQCWPSGAVVAAHVVNGEKVPADIRVSGPWGERAFTAVQPGRAGYVGFESRRDQVAAGSLTVAGYVRIDGVPSYQRRTVSYAAVDCS